jgi:hypothetical protein
LSTAAASSSSRPFRQSTPGASAYAASEADVRLLAKPVALECAADGIRVNTVLPAGVATPMWTGAPFWRDFVDEHGFAEAAWRALASDTPLTRFAQPQEVAEAIVFLASSAASYVTGTAHGRRRLHRLNVHASNKGDPMLPRSRMSLPSSPLRSSVSPPSPSRRSGGPTWRDKRSRRSIKSDVFALPLFASAAGARPLRDWDRAVRRGDWAFGLASEVGGDRLRHQWCPVRDCRLCAAGRRRGAGRQRSLDRLRGRANTGWRHCKTTSISSH